MPHLLSKYKKSTPEKCIFTGAFRALGRSHMVPASLPHAPEKRVLKTILKVTFSNTISYIDLCDPGKALFE